MQKVIGTLISVYTFSAVLCSCLNTKYAGQCVEVTCVSTWGRGDLMYMCAEAVTNTDPTPRSILPPLAGLYTLVSCKLINT